jgi:hypothetical protein
MPVCLSAVQTRRHTSALGEQDAPTNLGELSQILALVLVLMQNFCKGEEVDMVGWTNGVRTQL